MDGGGVVAVISGINISRNARLFLKGLKGLIGMSIMNLKSPELEQNMYA